MRFTTPASGRWTQLHRNGSLDLRKPSVPLSLSAIHSGEAEEGPGLARMLYVVLHGLGPKRKTECDRIRFPIYTHLGGGVHYAHIARQFYNLYYWTQI